MVAVDYLVVKCDPLRGHLIRKVLDRNRCLIKKQELGQEGNNVRIIITLTKPYIDDKQVTAMMFQLEEEGAHIFEHRGNEMVEFHNEDTVKRRIIAADERRRKVV